MDVKEWFTKHKWVILLAIYLFALTLQIIAKGWETFYTSAGIGLIVAILATVFNNSRNVKKIFRKIKYFFGYGMFKWEANSVFIVRKDIFGTLSSQEETLKKISKDALEHNDISVKGSEAIQMSFDKLRNLKIFLEEYVMYLDISITDADYMDEDENALIAVTIKTKASLRYRDNNKAINGLLLDFYYFFEKQYNPTEQKYTFKIQPENMPKDFLKKHFINEYSSDEVDAFSITSMKSKSSVERVNQKLLSLTTDRREELNSAIKNLILRLS
ncbi:hypothetical protein ACFU1R_27130 [Priestia megaterium]|uniref:hypothetical protein n=1 Tax=Priestia megaterium TaxID=1404 RepID=UPI00366E4AB1